MSENFPPGQRVLVTSGRRFGHVGTVLGTEWVEHCVTLRVRLDGCDDSELVYSHQLTREPGWPNQRPPIAPPAPTADQHRAGAGYGWDATAVTVFGLFLLFVAAAGIVTGWQDHRPAREWPPVRPDPLWVDPEDAIRSALNVPSQTEL